MRVTERERLGQSPKSQSCDFGRMPHYAAYMYLLHTLCTVQTSLMLRLHDADLSVLKGPRRLSNVDQRDRKQSDYIAVVKQKESNSKKQSHKLRTRISPTCRYTQLDRL